MPEPTLVRMLGSKKRKTRGAIFCSEKSGGKFSIWDDKIQFGATNSQFGATKSQIRCRGRRGTGNAARGTEKAAAAPKTGIAARRWLANGWRMAGE